jgi:hypothetical protein
MNTTAVIMMIFSILLLWGGLIVSILFMRARPQVPMEDPDLVPEDAVSRQAPLEQRGSHRDR